MNKKSIMWDFINIINNLSLMTDFIKNIFDYDNFYDHNYLFRMIDNNDEIIIDIYDNVSDNRFNRYIFSFILNDYDFVVVEENNVFVNYISVLNIEDCDNKLLKLAYLFSLNTRDMIRYSETFLDDKFIKLLNDIIK